MVKSKIWGPNGVLRSQISNTSIPLHILTVACRDIEGILKAFWQLRIHNWLHAMLMKRHANLRM